jgi:hypothetical protein
MAEMRPRFRSPNVNLAVAAVIIACILVVMASILATAAEAEPLTLPPLPTEGPEIYRAYAACDYINDMVENDDPCYAYPETSTLTLRVDGGLPIAPWKLEGACAQFVKWLASGGLQSWTVIFVRPGISNDMVCNS